LGYRVPILSRVDVNVLGYPYQRGHESIVDYRWVNSSQETPLSLIEVASLYKYTDDLLKNSDCNNFVKSVLNKVAANTNRPLKTTDSRELFRLVYEEGGFVWGQPRMGSGAARRNIGGGRRQIMFGRSVFSLPAATRQDAIATGIIGIHEVTHVATNQAGQPYYDEDLAQASYQAASELGYDLRGKNKPPMRTPGMTEDDWIGLNSNFYTGMLYNVCAGVVKK
jgi:hypothetical protein